MSDTILELSAAAAAAAIAAGDLDPAELFACYRERAAADPLNAFLWVAPPGPPAGLTEPTAGEAATPLAPVPLAVKDLFCTQGVPSQSASKILEGYRPPYSATVVARLGLPLLGKTNQDEFAMGSSNENSAFGPVANPWDRGRVPGGSSGGSAAAVAGGLAPWALGTDTGGSIRQPAAFCGIVGLKPTYGAVSRYGMIAFASSLDQAGPLTRDVTDAALLFSQMVGADPRDATCVAFPDRIGRPTATDLAGVRLGIPSDLLEAVDGLDPAVKANFDATVALAGSLGAEIVEVSLPHAEHALSAYYIIAPAEASANLARFDGVRYGLRLGGEQDLLSMYTRTRGEGFGPEVKRRIMLGTYALASGYYDAYYGTAQKVRTRISEDFTAAFGQVDLIVTPTAPTVAFGLGAVADPLAMYLNDFYTVPMSLAGIPAISIPSGLCDGLPVGFQLAGPAFSEARLLEAAHALEQAIGFDGAPARAGGTA
ncbi:Asp-tRNA(Asn)/Glu-tRNA(Gln) amidotransferase subunit GatA [Conexibacter sp. DBS9H8]|uniref:Asp-tRNA(Asn)/Glu-tRNA(Gln) amidotransferase subunit GatA n=1 Tax=Conexibacter sp. DBS9H8 TaxID=2937801 RepID=UPI00200FED66|nr:Asp-tRNA(Asn)/Glu-tRNA(Gln) amidotransferase subunit GatA [Conexibacter sp. DBS9H8]